MVKGRRRKTRFGTVVFIIPVVIIGAAVVYATIYATGTASGTLVVEAQSSSKYYPSVGLNVTVGVSGEPSGVTPYSLSVPAGTYTVTYPAERWYNTPDMRTITVSGGRTSYAVGTYDPIPDLVYVGQGGFNMTSVSALHRVTPVIWVNTTDQYQVIQSALTGRVIISPMQNYTYIFQQKGSYSFSILSSSSSSLLVVVG